MKKGIITGLTAVLVTSGFASAALAEEDETSNDEQQVEEEQDQEQEQEEELIDTLTMEDAIDHALNDNTSLLLLNYQLDNMRSQVDGVEDDHRDLVNDLDDLEDQMDDLREKQRETGQRTFQTRLQIQEEIESLEDKLEELEDSTQELDSNKNTLEYDQQKAEDNVELTTINTFTNLVMAKNQLDFLEKSLKTEKQTVSNMQKRYDIGLASREELDTAKREVTRLESEIAQSKIDLERDMAEFSLNIGITYHSDLSLEEPDVDEMEPVQQETETEKLMEDSYSMKTAKEELKLAEYNQEQVYADDDATSNEKEQADTEVTIAEENIVQLREELTTSIEQLFTQTDSQYQSVISTKDELAYANTDYQNLKTQVDIGVMPEAEYELAHIQVKEAEHNHKAAKQNYFLLKQQVEFLRSGLVQQQQQ